MAKRVIVIVSGETDRRSIPHLCRNVSKQASSFEVRKPPGNAALTPEQAARLIKAAWYEMQGRGIPPEKFIVLVDADAQGPDAAAQPFAEKLAQMVDIKTQKIVATAVRHLEAWFFADAEHLREFLGRDLGSVDTSQPDQIANPKLHLTNLLGHIYTAQIAERIASRLDPVTMQGRSPSFQTFIEKVQNGQSAS